MLGKSLRLLLSRLGYTVIKTDLLQGDMEPGFIEIHRQCMNFSMTSTANHYALHQAVRYIVQNNIPGDFVECGVWRGGSAMMIALTLKSLGVTDRAIHLYDTFTGMARPADTDIDYAGRKAIDQWQAAGGEWAAAPLEDVRKNLRRTGYPDELLHFVPGDVEKTLPDMAPNQIALLRLDTDWYASTYHELKHLYPRVATGGILIVDDYGYWQGSRQATDQYIAENHLPLYLARIDIGARFTVKP